MGIGSDLEVEAAEGEYEDNLKWEIAKEAARLITKKMGRDAAISKARKTLKAQHEALREEAYTVNEREEIEFLDKNLNTPPISKNSQSQVHAIARELYEDDLIDE